MGRYERIRTIDIRDHFYNYNWKVPNYYLPGMYIYKISFSDGETKTGKVNIK